MITFLIGGFWHGAGWNFIIWGAMHGTALIIHRIWQGTQNKMPRFLAWFLTFNFINATWVFFRATDWQQGISVLSAMLGMSGFIWPFPDIDIGLQHGPLVSGNIHSFFPEFHFLWGHKYTLLILGGALFFSVKGPNVNMLIDHFSPSLKTMLIAGTIGFIGLICLTSGFQEFLYFQF
jgi:hypothetical protein